MAAPINMAAKGHPLLVDLALVGQAKDLKATRVGQNGAMPAHKRVQTAKGFHQAMTRPQIKMISVGENQATACCGEIARLQGFDIGLSANWGKGGPGTCAMRGRKGAQARCALGLLN